MKYSSDIPYFYHVQTEFEQFWATRQLTNQRVLFIFGLGFDPRCVPAFRLAAKTLKRVKKLDTLCLRFKNPEDKNLQENTDGTHECLKEIEEISNSLNAAHHGHSHLEVNLFSQKDVYDGHQKLVSDFSDEYGTSLGEYTDIVVDISAFPRSLMYALLTRLQERLKPTQNLFAVLSEVAVHVEIEEQGYSDPHYIISARSESSLEPMIWIPILGGSNERLHKIYEFLNPKEVFPIVPFPTPDPRTGDKIVLRSRKLFDEWGVPFNNIMYACGDAPFDIYRKIHDIVERYRSFMSTDKMVVSALSGRSLSLGVLVAAWLHNLPVCQIQPITYKLKAPSRNELKQAAASASVTLYWLSGEIYQ
ncbi:MAG TPA: hypothetical protein VFO40_21090 [Chthoniobacterales bacterium]|nr:hypothetical protein [Chthoniobacterales bacterium]